MKRLLILSITGFCLITLIFTFYLAKKISKEFQLSEPFEIVMNELIQVDSLRLTDGYTLSPLVGGTLTQNSANFHIKIKTPKDKFSVYADLTKDKLWEIKEVSVTRQETVFIVLLNLFK